ncbi:type II toxin-antitoxin system HicB family antitoxin [Corticimicrobacter populi]|uniref:Antitoxin n=1 Tax=Corticimicrobacter populi TaxID=2175229 RepID=A0A2V1K1I4_9BURK|nr:type II toxin-antitoxin system HicB family antitoxin [Corticimicrobacter populi]PWF25076.1 antitoxin [Corticimicrobacter populi]
MYYPARIEPDTTGYMVSFRDIPEALSAGETLEEARFMAADALLTAMDFYFEDKRPVPMPSGLAQGEELVALPASAWAKVLLLNAFLDRRISKADLARAMDVRPQEVTRILDLQHPTKIDTISDALAALGKTLVISAK